MSSDSVNLLRVLNQLSGGNHAQPQPVHPSPPQQVQVHVPQQAILNSQQDEDDSPGDEYEYHRRRRRYKRAGGCNCRKSKCLKLYCECFAKQSYCSFDCNCVGCKNIDTEEFDDVRDNAIRASLDRNSSAFFRAPVAKAIGLQRKGCKCQKSMCAKNYCECYQSGSGCSDQCSCKDCHNQYGKKPKRLKRKRARDGGTAMRPASMAGSNAHIHSVGTPHGWTNALPGGSNVNGSNVGLLTQSTDPHVLELMGIRALQQAMSAELPVGPHSGGKVTATPGSDVSPALPASSSSPPNTPPSNNTPPSQPGSPAVEYLVQMAKAKTQQNEQAAAQNPSVQHFDQMVVKATPQPTPQPTTTTNTDTAMTPIARPTSNTNTKSPKKKPIADKMHRLDLGSSIMPQYGSVSEMSEYLAGSPLSSPQTSPQMEASNAHTPRMTISEFLSQSPYGTTMAPAFESVLGALPQTDNEQLTLEQLALASMPFERW